MSSGKKKTDREARAGINMHGSLKILILPDRLALSEYKLKL
jgi:hypothetical protein